MENMKLSRAKFVMFFLMPVMLAGCSITEPYVDRRRDAGQPLEKLFVGRSKPNAPSICYNGLITKFAEVQELADEECIRQETGVRAEFVNNNSFSCTLMTPTFANFKCVNE